MEITKGQGIVRTGYESSIKNIFDSTPSFIKFGNTKVLLK